MCVTCIIHRWDVTFDEREYRIEGGGQKDPPFLSWDRKTPPGVWVCVIAYDVQQRCVVLE